jgi:hypothetical protein
MLHLQRRAEREVESSSKVLSRSNTWSAFAIFVEGRYPHSTGGNREEPAGRALARVALAVCIASPQARREMRAWLTCRSGSAGATRKGAPVATEAGQVTGTKDKDYNVIWFTEQSLSNALRLQTYIEDAERDGDNELAEFFRRAKEASRKGGEQGKALLKARLGS